MDDIQNHGWDSDKQRQALQDDEISLLDYFRVIYKYRRMILLICGVAVVTTGIISLSSPKVYSATVSVVPPMEVLQRESGLGGALGAERSLILRKAIGVTGVAQMYAAILESRAVLDAIIDRFDLMDVYEEKQYKSYVRKALRGNTTVKINNEGIVTITVQDKDPQRAAAMANAYVEELDRQNKKLSAGQATSKRTFLENRLKEVEEKLSKIENILSREAKIQEMLFELLTTEYEMAKIEEAKNMPTIQVLDEAVVPEIRMPRGTKRKTAFAGAVSFMVAVFVAFARDYFARLKGMGSKDQWESPFRPGRQEEEEDIAFADLENKRKIVAARRSKVVQENGFNPNEPKLVDKG